MQWRWLGIVALMAWCGLAAIASADVVLENARLRLVLNDRGEWVSVLDRKSGRDYFPAGSRMSLAAVTIEGRSHQANAAARKDDRLEVRFAGCDTRLVYRVETNPDWIAWRLEEVQGPRPSRVTLLRLPVAIADHVGPRLGGAWNDEFGICVRAMNLQTDGTAAVRGAFAELQALSQDAPGPKLEGSAAAILAGSPGELRQSLGRLAAACDLPHNNEGEEPSSQSPLARQSYWFLSFGEKDVDRVIHYCRLAGVRQVMLSSGSWCSQVGHYTFQRSYYPDGLESLRRTVARLHAEGIAVGMHCFASKVSKTDAYVTPVPDRRFWVDRQATLAADIGPADTTIRLAEDLREWPGSPVASQKYWEGGVDKHREAIVDDEIICYQEIGPPGKWDTLTGCRRGAFATKPAAHRSGEAVRHYGVDGCINGYIVDQETSLFDETTTRLAEIFNACDFDMVYFDGGEDVDKRRFNYYVSKFQATAMSKFRKRPLVHMGTIMTHGLWHSFTRSGTVDTYLNTLHGHILAGKKIETWPTVRSHIDRSVDYMLRVRNDMIPGELGWFGIWPKGENTDGLQLDEIEYLMAKSIAYDAPISLQTSFAQMERHPLTPGILEIVRQYETLRAQSSIDEAARIALRQPGKDFCLVWSQDGSRKPVFIEVQPAAAVAGGREVRAMVGPLGDRGSVASIWHYEGRKGVLSIDCTGLDVRVADGTLIEADSDGRRTQIPIGPQRTTVRFPDLDPKGVKKLLSLGTIW